MSTRLPPRGDHQPDLFAANFADIPIRDQRDTMERPFFSLAKKPRYAPIEYHVGDVWVEVSANPKFGIASIGRPRKSPRPSTGALLPAASFASTLIIS
jgi:hypothetical protein